MSRTILDLVLIDRLNQLQSEDAFERLIMSAEVPISVKVSEDGRPTLIRGRADWVLGWGLDKTNTGSILVAIEGKGKNNASGMPQLLVYLAGIHTARQNRLNSTVFGLLSDGETFKFACLDNDKKLFLSRGFEWELDQKTILAFLDEILLDAINSSPHTTPIKTSNAILNQYGRWLKGKWKFG